MLIQHVLELKLCINIFLISYNVLYYLFTVLTCIYQDVMNRIQDGNQIGCNTLTLKSDIYFYLQLCLWQFNARHSLSGTYLRQCKYSDSKAILCRGQLFLCANFIQFKCQLSTGFSQLAVGLFV